MIQNAKKNELFFFALRRYFSVTYLQSFFFSFASSFVDKVCAGTTIIFVADEKERVFYGHDHDLYNVFL